MTRLEGGMNHKTTLQQKRGGAARLAFAALGNSLVLTFPTQGCAKYSKVGYQKDVKWLAFAVYVSFITLELI